MSLFVLSSKDGWVNIMYDGLDAVGIDQQVNMLQSPAVLLSWLSCWGDSVGFEVPGRSRAVGTDCVLGCQGFLFCIVYHVVCKQALTGFSIWIVVLEEYLRSHMCHCTAASQKAWWIRTNSHEMGKKQECYERDIVKFVYYVAFAKGSQESLMSSTQL